MNIALRRWMQVVGVIYVLMGVRLLPWINGPMIEAGLNDIAAPGLDLTISPDFLDFALDWMATLGLDLLVLGGALLFAARNPFAHRVVAHIVIWQEALRGVAADLWMTTRPYANPTFYFAFAAFHVVVIVTGVRALRKARVSDHNPEVVR
jgi:hypothetical protein